MGKKLAIKGHATRGKEVIELLEMMGGCADELIDNGIDEKYAYFIVKDENNVIDAFPIADKNGVDFDTRIFTLEEFLEKYPFKVGDKAVYEDDNDIVVINEIKWDDNVGDIFCNVKRIDENDCFLCPPELLKPYKETLETKVFGYRIGDVIFTNDTGWIRITKKLWDCFVEEHVYEGFGVINGHEYKDIRHHNVTGKLQLGHLKNCKDVDDVRCVNAIIDDVMINQITNKVSLIKFKPDVCDDKIELQLEDYDIEVIDGKTYAVRKKPKYPKTYKECLIITSYDKEERILYLLEKFKQLLICRNVYWKIAGEEMGLDGPWKPDYKNPDIDLYVIINTYNRVEKEKYGYGFPHCVLTFPTEEMRDAFYENFKKEIEECKELL